MPSFLIPGSNLDKTFGPSSNAFDETAKYSGTTMAYITGLASKQIYSVNLNTKESKIFKLTYRIEKMINSNMEINFNMDLFLQGFTC